MRRNAENGKRKERRWEEGRIAMGEIGSTDLLDDRQHPWLAVVISIRADAEVDLLRVWVRLVCCS